MAALYAVFESNLRHRADRLVCCRVNRASCEAIARAKNAQALAAEPNPHKAPLYYVVSLRDQGLGRETRGRPPRGTC